MANAKVNINELHKVASSYRADVNIWEIQREAEELYKAIKLVGIDNVTESYLRDDFIEDGKREEICPKDPEPLEHILC